MDRQPARGRCRGVPPGRCASSREQCCSVASPDRSAFEAAPLWRRLDGWASAASIRFVILVSFVIQPVQPTCWCSTLRGGRCGARYCFVSRCIYCNLAELRRLWEVEQTIPILGGADAVCGRCARVLEA